MSNSLIPRATIYQIEAARNQALHLYAEAFDALQRANEAHGFTVQSGPRGPVIAIGGYRSERTYGPNDRAEFLEEMALSVDRSAWNFLIGFTKLETLMDHKARTEFRRQLADKPPPVTAETCLATMEKLAGEADMIFKRGVAEAFSALDRRFRSHDGFKIGSRVVLARSMDENGRWNYAWHRDEQLRDVERAFYVLDGQPTPDRSGGIVGAIEAARGGWGAKAYTAKSDYFEARVFINGNIHLWFRRKDLVERVNLLLADYYGAVLGDGQTRDNSHAEPNRTPAKNFGFFETPEAVARTIIDQAYIRSTDRVLEPQAGRGAIARMVVGKAARVDCVEIQSHLVDQLRAIDGLGRVVHGDFLGVTPEEIGLYDRIVMNPPFDWGRDIDHVRHALQFLAPGGRLVAVMSQGVEFRQDRKATEFRKLLEEMGGRMHDLPAGSFAASGTMVNTIYVTISRRL